LNESLPQLGNRYFKERAGVTAVAGILNDLRCVWRETPNADVGIDGQIEHVDEDGLCTGRIVAAQIKSGPSYFEKATTTCIRFWAEEKHKKYWHDFPVPVVLILFEPNSKLAYWTDARRQLRSLGFGDSSPIEIPWEQQLDEAHRERLFETSGPIDGPVLEIQELPPIMAGTLHSDRGFDVSFLDLFAVGLTDSGRKLFYSMGTASEIAEARAVLNHGLRGFSVGQVEQDFCRRFIRFLVSQNLIHYDFTDFLIDWEDRLLQPTILCPLTVRGQRLLATLRHAAGDDSGVFHSRTVAIMEEHLTDLPSTLDRLLLLRDRLLASSVVDGGPKLRRGGSAAAV